jgi:hypothetical protein
MKETYKKRDDESLMKWVDRLSKEVEWKTIAKKDIKAILQEVSARSFFEGTNVGKGAHDEGI